MKQIGQMIINHKSAIHRGHNAEGMFTDDVTGELLLLRVRIVNMHVALSLLLAVVSKRLFSYCSFLLNF